MKKIPQRGTDPVAIKAALEQRAGGDVSRADGKAFAYVFEPPSETRTVAEEAMRRFMWSNALDPRMFPSAQVFEQEIVSMSAAHLAGDDQVVGNFTSGGTESIMLSVKAARDRARDELGIHHGQMVLPVTAHPAFHKAAAYLGVETIVVDVDPVTMKADPDRMAEAITSTTVMLVASAPSYVHGVIDPIEAIGGLAQEHDLWFHVDACIGGFLLPFMRELGVEMPRFDFSVPGVTAISMDFHKYAYAPKGAAVLLLRERRLRRHQIFTYSAWPGYAVVNPTMQSSRSTGPIAATWAVLHHLGMEGYRDIARDIGASGIGVELGS